MTENYGSRAEFIGIIEEQVKQEVSYEIMQCERGVLCKIVLCIQRPNGKIDRLEVIADREELKRHRIGKGLLYRHDQCGQRRIVCWFYYGKYTK